VTVESVKLGGIPPWPALTRIPEPLGRLMNLK
jgi:hypothetical protein